MAIQRTLSILKPDVTRRNITGKINTMIENAGFKIVAQKRIHLSRREARLFYEVHKDRPFYDELVEFMVSAPVVVQVLESENAVDQYRELMGATNPKDAAPGTIRKEHSLSISENSVHGSDSLDNAKREISFFFSDREILS